MFWWMEFRCFRELFLSSFLIIVKVSSTNLFHSDGGVWLGNRIEKRWMLPMPLTPANPNAQDQFMDAVQGPANQTQGPAVQNQAQGPAAQAQVQGQAAQGSANNNAQIGQNVPVQPPQQLAPAQPVPTGPVVPAFQVFYHNWIGKKPEFSGKPEEDLQNHIFLLLEIGWKPTTFPDEGQS